MNINEYQLAAHGFADYTLPFVTEGEKPTRIDYCYPVMGLAEEAGEVSGKFAKAVRDNGGVISEERKTEIVKELGDVCWFVAEICTLQCKYGRSNAEKHRQTYIKKRTWSYKRGRR